MSPQLNNLGICCTTNVIIFSKNFHYTFVSIYLRRKKKLVRLYVRFYKHSTIVVLSGLHVRCESVIGYKNISENNSFCTFSLLLLYPLH